MQVCAQLVVVAGGDMEICQSRTEQVVREVLIENDRVAIDAI